MESRNKYEDLPGQVIKKSPFSLLQSLKKQELIIYTAESEKQKIGGSFW